MKVPELPHMAANRAKIAELFEGLPPMTQESAMEELSKLAPEAQAMVHRINTLDFNRMEKERTK